MTPDLQAIRTELQQMRQLLQTVVATHNRHLDRHEMAQRLGISTGTANPAPARLAGRFGEISGKPPGAPARGGEL